MTIFEKGRRKASAKKSVAVKKVPRNMKCIPSMSSLPDLHARPTIRRETEMRMKQLTESIIMDKGGSCGFVRIADALKIDSKLKDSHAKKRGFRGAIEGFANAFAGAFNVGMGLRYQLTNALDTARFAKGALSISVASWPDVKEVLSEFMDFEQGESFQDKLLNEASIVESSKFVTSPFQREMVNEEELIPSSVAKYRAIIATPPPQKISEQPKEEMDPLSLEIARQHAEREEAERNKQAELEEIERRLEEKEKEEEAKKMASSVLRDFTDEEEAIVEEAIFGGGPVNEVLQKEGSDTVNRKSMHTLQPGQWLNDEVIHFFYIMLSKRDEELCEADPSRKRSHFFKSFFMTKLTNEGHSEKDGMYEYKNVKRWSKKVPGGDIFNLDKIFFPINEGRMHWVCAIAFMQEKRIQFYDSMGADGSRYLEYIFRYIQDEHKAKKQAPLPNADEWQLVTCTDDTPRQGNGFDCGVFTCCFADFVAKDCPLLFTQQHVNKCRKRIALSIMRGKAIV